MSGPKYLLDTNILIGFLGGKDWAFQFLTHAASFGSELLVSSITRMELLSFPDITKEEESKILALLDQLQKIAIDESIEDAAISLRRGTKLRLPDAIIAATAIAQSAVLVTADSDFKKIPELSITNPMSQEK